MSSQHLDTGRVYSVVYNPDLINTYIWPPLLFATATGMSGFVLNLPWMTLLSAFSSAFAIHFWPFTSPTRIILQLDDQGLAVDGIGRISWSDIDHVEVVELPRHPKRLVAKDVMRVALNRPLEQAAKDMPEMDRPAWHTILPIIENPSSVLVPLNRLSDEPADIARAFSLFLSAK